MACSMVNSGSWFGVRIEKKASAAKSAKTGGFHVEATVQSLSYY